MKGFVDARCTQVIKWNMFKLSRLQQQVAMHHHLHWKLHQLTLRFLSGASIKGSYLFLVDTNDSRVRLMPWTERRRLCSCSHLSARRYARQQVSLRRSMKQNTTRANAVVMNESYSIQHCQWCSQQSTYFTGLEAQETCPWSSQRSNNLPFHRFGDTETCHTSVK